MYERFSLIKINKPFNILSDQKVYIIGLFPVITFHILLKLIAINLRNYL
jgi:hypothetical protein